MLLCHGNKVFFKQHEKWVLLLLPGFRYLHSLSYFISLPPHPQPSFSCMNDPVSNSLSYIGLYLYSISYFIIILKEVVVLC